MMIRTTISFAALAMLSACGSDDPASEEGAPDADSTAAGEVLGGTISDDMLPLEQLTSQSPPAEATATSTEAVTTSTSEDGTSVEVTRSTSVSSSGEEGPPPPAPPEPPAVQTEAQ